MLIVISGPSGVGKKTVVTEILKQLLPDVWRCPVSWTTRSPKPTEVNGGDYHFTDEATFREMIGQDKFVEWVRTYDCYYGTHVDELARAHEESLILEIDIRGARRIKELYPDAHTIFLLPPSPEELRNRLLGRGRGESAEEVAVRLAHAEVELCEAGKCDCWFPNDDLNMTLARVKGAISLRRDNVRMIPKEIYRNPELLARTQAKFSSASMTSS